MGIDIFRTKSRLVNGQCIVRLQMRKSLPRSLVCVLVAAMAHACLLPDAVGASEPLRPFNYEPAEIAFSGLALGRKSVSPTSFRPRRDVQEWDASLPIDWSADPFGDPNWQYQLHAWRVMAYQLYEYRDTEDPAWLREAIEIALDWAHYHVDLGRSEKFSWYDMAAGIRAARLAFMLDRILSERVDCKRYRALKHSCIWRIYMRRNFRIPDSLATGNHAIFQLVGLDMLCEVISWRNSCGQGDAREYARHSFESLLKSQFTEQGVHAESSPTYHQWVLRTLRDSGALERLDTPSIMRLLEDAANIAPWLAYPDRSWIAVGDSAGTGPRAKVTRT